MRKLATNVCLDTLYQLNSSLETHTFWHNLLVYTHTHIGFLSSISHRHAAVGEIRTFSRCLFIVRVKQITNGTSALLIMLFNSNWNKDIHYIMAWFRPLSRLLSVSRSRLKLSWPQRWRDDLDRAADAWQFVAYVANSWILLEAPLENHLEC